MKNKIGNKLYQITKMSYRNGLSDNIEGVDLTIKSFKIVKETPKYYFLQSNILSTYCFGINKISNRDYGIVRYKKENVEINGVENKDFLISRLDKIIDIINKDDDISNNHKKQYKLSYDLIIEYLKENDF